MAIILNIDTATPVGSVCLSKDGELLASRVSENQKDHASVIAPFAQEVLKESGVNGKEVDAVAISSGPGSYTGLRVATSSSKGLCYAWNIPLIAISTLKMMANGMKNKTRVLKNKEVYLCPMIDARRMEVFTTLYNMDLDEEKTIAPVVLTADFFQDYENNEVMVFGTGQPKAEKLLSGREGWEFKSFSCNASQLIPLAEEAYRKKAFADLAYFEPFYLKSVYLPEKSKK